MSEVFIKAFQYIVSRKWFYLFLVPVLLIIFGLGFTIYHILTYDAYFTVMPVSQDHNAMIQIPQSELVDGQIIKGEFIATMNNLGAVGIRIKDTHFQTVPDDFHVFFRLKEKGAKTWYSSNSYLGGQFHELNLFPFGFPLIFNSEGKTYDFELFTKGADSYNAPTVETNQSIVGEYALQKSDLKKPANAIRYIEGKLLYLFHHVGGVLYILIYFLPLYTYLYLLAEKERTVIPFWFSLILLIPLLRKIIALPSIKCINFVLRTLYKYKIIEKYEPITVVPTILVILFFAILIEIFLIDTTDNLLLTIIVLLWSISIGVFKIRLQTSFLMAIMFLLLSFALAVVTLESFAEQSAIWAYLFLIIGAVHAIVVARSNKESVKHSKQNKVSAA